MHTKGGHRDTLIGAITVCVAVVLLGLVYVKEDPPGRSQESSYVLAARFNRSDGIGVGSDVRMSGLRVGKVVAQQLEPDFRAMIHMSIDHHLVIPRDSAALIYTDGLLGAKYIEIKPGGDDAELKPGDEITMTQDAMVLDELLEMIIQQARSKRGFLDKPVPSVIN